MAGVLTSLLPPAWAAQEPRLPVPSENAQLAAEKTVKEVFRADYALKTTSGQLALAKKLMQQGFETKDDVAIRFVLLREAADLASRGDLETLTTSIEELCREYRIDSWALSGAVLVKAEAVLAKPEELRKLGEAHQKVARAALDQDQYDLAARSAQAAAAVAKKGKDAQGASRADAMIRAVAESKASSDKAKKAEQLLAANPQDPAANLTLGEYLCFTKGRWDTGLPCLAKAPEGELKALALRELGPPESVAALIQIADAWWDQVEKEKNAVRKEHLAIHSKSLYQKALPKTEGLLKFKLLQRLGPPQLQDAPVLAGLTGQWLFEDGSGIQVADSGGKSNHGDVVGSLRWVPGCPGTAGEFDGATYVSCALRECPAYATPMTIAWSQRVKAPPTGRTVIFGLADPEAKVAISVGYMQSGAFGVWKWADEWLATAPPPAANEWHHYAYTFDGKTHRLYADGVVASNTTVHLDPKAPFKRLEFGRWGGGGGAEAGFFFVGCLDNVRIYNRALPDAEVRVLLESAK
jgi:hypothetical protein